MAVPGVSQCTHIDFFCDGSKALEGRVQVFLRAKAVDIYVKLRKSYGKRKTRMRRLGEMAAEMGQDTHQLWDDGCFYVGLDLPQVPGLILEVFFNIIV